MSSNPNRIADYALLGNCRTAALVGRDGSIDWAPFPRFDSPALLCRLLDAERGGTFRIAPEPEGTVERSYVEDTNVLVTTFASDEAEIELTDAMAVDRAGQITERALDWPQSILGRVRCTRGAVNVDLHFDPRFEYGASLPRFTPTSERSVEIIGGADALRLTATRPVDCEDERVTARWRLQEGEEVWLQLTWTPSFAGNPETHEPSAAEIAQRLHDTLAFWRDWMAGCRYAGPHATMVRRSALTLKALTFGPAGALVAAATTSLPEWPGGTRNWDYRYTWIRDATLPLASLVVLGFRGEADACE